MKKIEIVILGTEHCHIRGVHRLLSGMADVTVGEIWGETPQKLAEYASLFGAAILDKPEDMRPVDLAIVLSDTRNHKRLIEAAKGKARAVHVDKPLGLSASDSVEIARLASSWGTQFGVGFFARQNTLIDQFHKAVIEGRIGRLRHLSITMGHAGQLEGWLEDWPAMLDVARMGYGSFGDLAGNALDIANRMIDGLKPVACVLENSITDQRDTGGVAVLRGRDGAMVRLFCSTTMRGPRMELRADGDMSSLWYRGQQLGGFDDWDKPVIHDEGRWPEASDSIRALLTTMKGEKPIAPVATADEAAAINQQLDDLQALAGLT